jgi:hypothetical protein
MILWIRALKPSDFHPEVEGSKPTPTESDLTRSFLTEADRFGSQSSNIPKRLAFDEAIRMLSFDAA